MNLILGIIIGVLIAHLCFWLHNPEDFKAFIKSIGGGGIKPPNKKNDEVDKE